MVAGKLASAAIGLAIGSFIQRRCELSTLYDPAHGSFVHINLYGIRKSTYVAFCCKNHIWLISITSAQDWQSQCKEDFERQL